MRSRKILMAGFGMTAMGMTVVTATSAWAWCSPSYMVEATLLVAPIAATSGTEVTVAGKSWASGTYQVVWAPTREVLATAIVTDGQFLARFQMPEVAPQMYQEGLKVEQDGKQGKDALAFQVLTPAEAAQRQEAGVGAAQTASVTGPSTASSDSGPGLAPVSPAPGRGGTQIVPGVQAAPSVGSGAGPSPLVAGAANPAARQDSGLAGVVQPAVAPGDRLASPSAVEDAPGAPSSKTALGDLWDGFSGGLKSPSGPGLVDLPQSSSNPLTSPGVLLLGAAGLGALVAGFGLTEARRRRAASVSVTG